MKSIFFTLILLEIAVASPCQASAEYSGCLETIPEDTILLDGDDMDLKYLFEADIPIEFSCESKLPHASEIEDESKASSKDHSRDEILTIDDMTSALSEYVFYGDEIMIDDDGEFIPIFYRNHFVENGDNQSYHNLMDIVSHFHLELVYQTYKLFRKEALKIMGSSDSVEKGKIPSIKRRLNYLKLVFKEWIVQKETKARKIVEKSQFQQQTQESIREQLKRVENDENASAYQKAYSKIRFMR